MRRHQLPEEVKEKLMERPGELLAQREEVEFACVHGSFRDPEIEFRDIDVAVWLDPLSVRKEEALEYEGKRSTLLEHHITYQVDVKVLNYASLGFRYAASGGVLIFARDLQSWYKFCEKTWIEYLDFLPWSRQMLFDLLSA